MNEYQSGDVIVMRLWGGRYRDVLVDDINTHNGHPAFTGWLVEETCDGYLATTTRVWGYQAQIIHNLGPTVLNREMDTVFVYNH